MKIKNIILATFGLFVLSIIGNSAKSVHLFSYPSFYQESLSAIISTEDAKYQEWNRSERIGGKDTISIRLSKKPVSANSSDKRPSGKTPHLRNHSDSIKSKQTKSKNREQKHTGSEKTGRTLIVFNAKTKLYNQYEWVKGAWVDVQALMDGPRDKVSVVWVKGKDKTQTGKTSGKMPQQKRITPNHSDIHSKTKEVNPTKVYEYCNAVSFTESPQSITEDIVFEMVVRCDDDDLVMYYLRVSENEDLSTTLSLSQPDSYGFGEVIFSPAYDSVNQRLYSKGPNGDNYNIENITYDDVPKIVLYLFLQYLKSGRWPADPRN